MSGSGGHDTSRRAASLLLNDRISPGQWQTAFLILFAVALALLAVGDVFTTWDSWLGLAAVLAVVVGMATLLVPWSRFPREVVALLPILDIVVVGVAGLDTVGPATATVLVLPAMWLAVLLGRRAAGVCLVVTFLFVGAPLLLPLGGAGTDASLAVLIPVAVAGISFGLADVIDAVRVERAEVARQRRISNAILDTVDVGLVLLDADGAYQATNRRHRDFMRLAFPEGHRGVAGQLGKVYGEDGRTLLGRQDMPTQRARHGEEFDDCRIWVGDEPLTRRALSVSARSVRDDTGAFAGAALAYKDVTDFMRAMEVKDGFIATVSHELRTPLTSIRGYADLLMDRDDLPEEAVRQLSVVVRNSERLGKLVGDLLHSAQIESGPVQVDRTRGDLALVVRDAVSAAVPAAAASRIEVRCVGPERLVVMMDQDRMRQVADNLLSNAIKYTPPNGEVLVHLAVDGGRVELSVSDTGIGIDPADRDRLFTRFFRARHAEEQSIQGVGLGLSITKSIVESHGGRIEVDSEVGRGSVFRVRVPVDGA